MTNKVLKLTGTSNPYFQIGIGGPIVNNNSGVLEAKNAAGTSYVNLTALGLTATGGVLTLNGATYNVVIEPSSSQTATYTLTLPVSAGTAGQVLSTDGTGVLSWVASGNTTHTVQNIDATIAYGSTSPVTIGTLPANAIVTSVNVYVDTAFNATSPSLSVGIAGTTSKYMGTTDLDLTTAGSYAEDPGLPADTSSESIIATFAAGTGGTAGSARVIVYYTTPV
jgi:hypothetical protein